MFFYVSTLTHQLIFADTYRFHSLYMHAHNLFYGPYKDQFVLASTQLRTDGFWWSRVSLAALCMLLMMAASTFRLARRCQSYVHCLGALFVFSIYLLILWCISHVTKYSQIKSSQRRWRTYALHSQSNFEVSSTFGKFMVADSVWQSI